MEHTEATKGHLCLFFEIKRISDPWSFVGNIR